MAEAPWIAETAGTWGVEGIRSVQLTPDTLCEATPQK
jgi:hypothetical protein